jgi:hypothetical protein
MVEVPQHTSDRLRICDRVEWTYRDRCRGKLQQAEALPTGKITVRAKWFPES